MDSLLSLLLKLINILYWGHGALNCGLATGALWARVTTIWLVIVVWFKIIVELILLLLKSGTSDLAVSSNGGPVSY